jgi:DisA checkpoint controller-like protein
LYQWKILRFTSPRPFVSRELVKLAMAGTDRRIYTAVNLLPDGSLAIAGLAREGLNVDPDPFVKIVASGPGSLSIRSGSDLMLGYERGTTLTEGTDLVFSVGLIRQRLEALARKAGLDDDVVPQYVRSVRSLVREMTAHGHGGILIISDEDDPDAATAAAYHMERDSSLAALFQLARHLDRPTNRPGRATQGDVAFRNVLRSTFLAEVERVTEELGALTAIDGAVVLNRDLALVAFGVLLPLRRSPAAVAHARNAAASSPRILDLGARGTRHRAGVTYAADHAGDVVFVASEDGDVSCMFRETTKARTLLWHLGPGERGAA